MSEESGTKPVPSKYDEETVRLVVKREYTTGGRLRKMTLKTLVFLFIFSLGFILGKLCFTGQTDQVDNSHQSAYVYDTEQKIEDFYKMFERAYSKETGLPPESPEVKKFMATMRKMGQPLVAVGPFAVFVNDDGSEFSVRDTSLKQETALLFPLVELKSSEQSKRLRLYSLQEKGSRLPRFHAELTYSKDGVYEKGRFSVHGKDGSPEKIYFDSQGIGVFNRMGVLENDTLYTYHLNDHTWELTSEQPYPETLKKNLDSLKDNYRLLRDGKQVDHNTSKDNQDY